MERIGVIFLQVTSGVAEKLSSSEKNLLIGIILALTSAIVGLVLYIRSLHHKQLAREKENLTLMVGISKEFVQATHDFKATIDANMKSSDRLIDVVDHMHKNILEALRITPPRKRSAT